LPVIGANRGGIPELIDASCGWTFDPDREGELEAILQNCVREPGRLRSMRSAAHARSHRFSLETTVSGYLAAYRDAIAGGN
jgi:glycosyltransferase involved in cell wall biosynthesis